MSQTTESVQDELAGRHRAAVRVIVVVFVLTLVLAGLALSGMLGGLLERDIQLEWALRIAILVFGFGAITLRRTRFAAMRLRDIGALRGPSGLLQTLQRTTVYVALIGGAIALMGFVVSLMTESGSDMIWVAIVAVVLTYAYPQRAAWQRVVEAAGQPDGGDAGRAAKGTIA